MATTGEIQVTTINVSVEQNTVANDIKRFGNNPVQVVCPTCNQHIVTQVQEVMGVFTWVMFGAMCLFCPWFSCFPLCTTQCKDLHHFCPNCRTLVGVKKPLD